MIEPVEPHELVQVDEQGQSLSLKLIVKRHSVLVRYCQQVGLVALVDVVVVAVIDLAYMFSVVTRVVKTNMVLSKYTCVGTNTQSGTNYILRRFNEELYDMDSHRLHFFEQKKKLLSAKSLLLWTTSAIVTLLLIFVFWMSWLPQNQIAHGVAIANTSLSGLTPEQAKTALQENIPTAPNRTITATFEEKTWRIPTQDLQESPALDEMTMSAMGVGRTGSWPEQIQDRWASRVHGTMLPAMWRFDREAVYTWVASVSAEINLAGQEPSVSLVQNTVQVDPGSRGIAVDEKLLANRLAQEAGKSEDTNISIVVEPTITPLSADGIQASEARAEKIKTLRFRLQGDEAEAPILIPSNQVLSWLQWPSGVDSATISAQLAQLTQPWVRAPQAAQMEFSDDTSKLSTFVPHRAGREVLLEKLEESIRQSIQAAEATTSATIPEQVIAVEFQEEVADVTLGDLNSLGITERIAVGTSEYAGSIPNRVFNVSHTAEKLHGTIILPGEEFSFNETIGEISGKTGFKSAYVIMNGRTQLGDGGGVCQVSTTLFRAVLQGGFPITRWKAHSYRVGYYEQNSQPGFDATVYAPSVDFRFQNDSEHAIAIAAYPDSERRFLTVEFWGTSDDRTSEISEYRMWNQRSAPEPAYVEDPNLPAGQRQQIDWAAAGANASFHYVAKDKDGNVIQDREFMSVFRPWQAVYLVGTGGQ